MKWYPYELHTHTLHSDGVHTLIEMAKVAKSLGIEGLALTDHNTMSGLVDQDNVEEETGLHIVRGLEWTTFYGHMLILGINQYEDWRNLSLLDIEQGMKRVREQNALVGIAHPFDMGTPICTGCHWEYEIENWDLVDYIEVWNGTLPSVTKSNKRAFSLWTDKLNQGYRIPATSGRDWHNTAPNEKTPAVTFLEMEESDDMVKESSVLTAVKSGRMSISLGPLLLLSGKLNESYEPFKIGDEVDLTGDNKEAELNIKLDYSVRDGKWELPDQTLKVLINSNQGVLEELSFENATSEKKLKVNLEGVNWVRAELHGELEDHYTVIAFTNPIYFNHS